MPTVCATSDLLVFSHLRWDFIVQRPHHLIARYAKFRRVYYIEEPVFGVTTEPRLFIKNPAPNIHQVIPYFPAEIDANGTQSAMMVMLSDLLDEENIHEYTSLYYNPSAIHFTRHLTPVAVIYECTNETIFPQEEEELMNKSQLIITSGHSLFESKEKKHFNVHSVPGSVDLSHFFQGRYGHTEPQDQMMIPHPRIGFYGVIDEKVNLHLIEIMAEVAPEFQFILIGPIFYITPDEIPKRPNIHYLGKKDYAELPIYLSGWDAVMMPYKTDELTRMINPSKAIEFLAAGKPVVSTSLPDLIHPFGDAKLVHIADHPEQFVQSLEQAMNERAYDPEWLERVDKLLEGESWDSTFQKVAYLEQEAMKKKDTPLPAYMDQSLHEIGIV